MGTAGRVIAIVSALLIPIFLLLPFITAGPLSPRDYSGWEIYSGADIIVTLDGAAVIAVAVAAFFTRDSPAFGGVVIALGAFVLGHMLPEEVDPARRDRNRRVAGQPRRHRDHRRRHGDAARFAQPLASG